MAAKKTITIEDLWAMARVSSPTVSADGKWACVSVTRYDMDDNSSRTNLWLLATDGSSQRQLTRGKNDGDPQFSPDGRSIAFVARRSADDVKDASETSHLYVIDIDGGEARRLTTLNTGVFGIRWHPDNKRIAFLSWTWPNAGGEAEQNKRFAQDKRNKVRALVAEHNHYRYWDHWLPQNRDIHVWMVSIKGGRATDLLAGSSHWLPAQDPNAGMYDFTPDGKALVFVQERERNPKAPAFSDIVLRELRSGATRNLTAKSTRSHEHPRVSPDGKSIACLSSNYQLAHNEQPRLALIDIKSSKLRGITFDWDLGVNAPLEWSSDSQRVVFSAELGEIQPLFSVSVAGGAPAELSRGPNHGGSSGPAVLAKDSATMVYLRASIGYPPTLFAANQDGSGERQIEHFNQAHLKGLRLATSESVTLHGFHGDKVQMWIIKPPGFDARKKWPLMHVIHGGPHTCFGDTWHWRWNAQLFAAKGWVVSEVNYHGSTGFGQAFVGSINGDWGRRELADVEAGTDYMLATGYIDAKRVVATGGSYGGYMVAYMNGCASPRYQAYVCHAGCYDWVAMMGSDGYFWFGEELGAYHWEDEKRVLKQSPHHFAGNFATPTLVIHGELDYRVPYYQGMAYYNTLRVKEIPTRMVFFPDENHWILKPQNSRLWYKEFFDWCGRFTKPSQKSPKASSPTKVAAKKRPVARQVSA
jgi:dipeptidyl aminopeptidase/acylaminoacyl peptidase